MDMNELKKAWAELDINLKLKQLTEERILREMTSAKSGKALSRLVNYAYLGAIISVLGIIPIVYLKTHVHYGPFKTTIFVLIFLLFLVGFAMNISNILLLHKIDFFKPVNENIRLTRSYEIRIKKQLLSLYLSIIVIMILAIIASALSPNMELWRWAAIIAVIFAGIVCACWEYKRIYRKNIDSILSSLDELKELEEER